MATTYYFITPPKKNTAWEFWCCLTSQADTDIFQDNPTLAAGDVTVLTDGSNKGNIDTLPSAVVGATRWLYVQLSADEMNGDKWVGVLFHDQSGDEWQDAAFIIMVEQAVTVSDFDESTDKVTVTSNEDKTGYSLSATGIDGIIDEVIEGTTTLRQGLRLMFSILFGKLSGGGTTNPKFRDIADSKDRVDVTTDASGNRTSVTLDGD